MNDVIEQAISAELDDMLQEKHPSDGITDLPAPQRDTVSTVSEEQHIRPV